EHVAHRAAAAWHGRLLGELQRAGVERYELVRMRRLHYPDAVLVVAHHGVGPSVGAAGKLPLVELAGRGIVAPELARRVVTVPDLVVRRDLHPARPRLGARQRELAQLHRRRIDHGDLVRTEFHEPGTAFGVHLDAVGPRVLRRDLDQANDARPHGQVANG